MGGSVLVVDDDPSFVSLARRMLEQAGLEVCATAPDADTAVAKAREHEPDGALVDVGLPGRDGIDLCRELTALPSAPRVVLTSIDPDAMALVAAADRVRGVPFVAKQDLPAAPLRRLLCTD